MKAAALSVTGLLFALPGPHSAPRPPIQYLGNTAEPITVFYADPLTVDGVCRDLTEKGNGPDKQVPASWTIYACTNIAARRSLMPDPCLPMYQGESFADLACHEKGHANGWGWEYG